VQIQEEYYVGNQRVAYYANSALHFQHQDWEGTERMRTTFNGAVEGTFTSMPFGDAFATVSGSDGDAYHYAKLDHDYSSDTDHAQFRQYSSTPGRWMSPDPYDGSYNPLDPQSLNRYSYVLNNPVAYVDPSGLFCEYYVDAGDQTGQIEEWDFNSSVGECASTGGTWSPDGTGGGDAGNNGAPGNGADTGAPAAPSGPAGPGAGGGGPGAPSNAHQQCVKNALLKGAATTALDAIGTLPEGGTVASALSLYNGAAGASNGTKILGRFAFAGALVSTASATHDLQGPQESTFSTFITGLQATAGGAGIAKGLIEDIPVAGQVFAAVSVGLDILGTGVDIYNCPK
jgi:RHS repeat-associated protein